MEYDVIKYREFMAQKTVDYWESEEKIRDTKILLRGKKFSTEVNLKWEFIAIMAKEEIVVPGSAKALAARFMIHKGMFAPVEPVKTISRCVVPLAIRANCEPYEDTNGGRLNFGVNSAPVGYSSIANMLLEDLIYDSGCSIKLGDYEYSYPVKPNSKECRSFIEFIISSAKEAIKTYIEQGSKKHKRHFSTKCSMIV